MVAADAGTDSIVRPANRRTTLRYVRFAYTSTSARTTSAGRDYWAGWLAVRGLPAKVERPTRDRAAERDADEIVSSIAQSLDLGEDNTGWFSSLCSGTLKHCSDNGSRGKKKKTGDSCPTRSPARAYSRSFFFIRADEKPRRSDSRAGESRFVKFSGHSRGSNEIAGFDASLAKSSAKDALSYDLGKIRWGGSRAPWTMGNDRSIGEIESPPGARFGQAIRPAVRLSARYEDRPSDSSTAKLASGRSEFPFIFR